MLSTLASSLFTHGNGNNSEETSEIERSVSLLSTGHQPNNTNANDDTGAFAKHNILMITDNTFTCPLVCCTGFILMIPSFIMEFTLLALISASSSPETSLAIIRRSLC